MSGYTPLQETAFPFICVLAKTSVVRTSSITVVVLMNLLNGLAVSDTGMIREKAEVVSAVSRVETISYIESLLLGDPFGFLSNWPVVSWLRYISNRVCNGYEVDQDFEVCKDREVCCQPVKSVID